MELNEINESYKKQKAKVKKIDTDKTKKAIESMKKQVIALTDELEDLQTKKARAERDKDSAKVKATEQEMKTKKEELKKVKGNLAKLGTSLEQAKSTLDDHLKLIEEMAKSNPELKAQLDTALKIKFKKAVERNKVEKEKLSKQIEPYKIIRDAASKDPNVMYMIKDIEKQTKTINEQEAILTDPKKSAQDKAKAQTLLDLAKSTLESQRSSLAKYFKGTIKREDIDKIQSLDEIDKEIKSTDRKITSLDKQNANYQTALENIDINKSDNSKGGKSGLPATKPKWYQFIKKFKNWYHRNDSTPEPDPELEDDGKKDKKPFTASLKYDVVRAYKDKLEQQYLKDAKVQNKKATSKDKDNDGPEL